MEFSDRRDAGIRLGEKLSELKLDHPVIMALPRGGVPIAFEVARKLTAPLDVLVVKKIGAPGNPELALGAVAEDGTFWWNNQLIEEVEVGEDYLERIKTQKLSEAKQQAETLRGTRASQNVSGRNVIVVDDGLATGATALAAVELLKKRGASSVCLAVPVSSPRTSRLLKRHADQVISLKEPENLYSVGSWYRDFTQVTDSEILELLRMRGMNPVSGSAPQEVVIPSGTQRLTGELTIPTHAKAVIVFVHGSGSSRKSPRNTSVARALNEMGLGTLLFDLLTPDESQDSQNIFNVRLMTERTIAVTKWLRTHLETLHLPIGYFGSSTGAAAALCAASELGREVFAVVSRGGRPDLASHCLPRVTAPTLLLVGANDQAVLSFNRYSKALLAESELVIIPHAGHLFDEVGAMEKVIEQSQSWFLSQIANRQAGTSASAPEELETPSDDFRKISGPQASPNHKGHFRSKGW